MDKSNLSAFVRADGVQAVLETRGLLAESAARKAGLFQRCGEALAATGLSLRASVRAFFVPGRIEVLGKHTDYAGGRSLICAADRGFCVLVAPRDDALIQIAAGDGRGGGRHQSEFTFSAELTPVVGDWTNYPMSVARRLARNFPGPLRGADIAFASDLPPGAGMSSSSALVIACYLAMASVNDIEDRPEYRSNIRGPEDLAGYIATHENGQSFGSLAGDKGVGTFGGSEDHTAILCCRAGSLSLYSYCPVRFERRLAMPPGYCFAIASSGVTAEKTGSALAKYNRASLLVRAAVSAWNQATGRRDAHLAAAMGSSSDAMTRIRQVLAGAATAEFSAEQLTRRVEQFYEESMKIIPSACDALAKGDLAAFGTQVDRSQELAQHLLENQVEETIHLAASARELGAAASSAFGAGFGGAVWALVPLAEAGRFIEQWAEAYRGRFPARAAASEFILTAPGPAAMGL